MRTQRYALAVIASAISVLGCQEFDQGTPVATAFPTNTPLTLVPEPGPPEPMPLWPVETIVFNITPETNSWGSPCAITWGDPSTGTGYSAKTSGVCLFTLSLKKADPTITNSLLAFWWGSANPTPSSLYDHIQAQNHFTNVTDFADALPGDILVTKYISVGNITGYLMILAEKEEVGVANGVRRFLVEVYDSTRSPHGPTDTRWEADSDGHVIEHDHGVGSGYIYVDTNAATGAVVGHSWSTVLNGSYYTQSDRSLVVGRFVR